MKILDMLKQKRADLNKLIIEKEFNKERICENEQEITMLRTENYNLDNELLELEREKMVKKNRRKEVRKNLIFSLVSILIISVGYAIAGFAGLNIASVIPALLLGASYVPPFLCAYVSQDYLENDGYKQLIKEIEQKHNGIEINNKMIDFYKKEIQARELKNIDIDFSIDSIISEFVPEQATKPNKIVYNLLNNEKAKEKTFKK